MGLDQYAYAAMKAGQREEFFDDAELDENKNWVSKSGVSEPKEIAYWRKHPNLHGWMENLWREKNMPGVDPEYLQEEYEADFNGIELELTWEDVDRLEKDIKAGEVGKLETTGFFFGNPSDDYYREHDLKFCVDAKAEIFLGFKVFYNSSW